MTNKSPPGRTQ